MACKVDLTQLVVDEAQAQGVPPALALALAWQESRMCHWAVTGDVVRSSAGAIGVLQVMPATAAQLGIDPYQVDQNIYGGLRYLRQQYDRFGSWALALAAYNAGPGSVSSNRIPSITQSYVAAILARAGINDAAQQVVAARASGDDVPPSPQTSTLLPWLLAAGGGAVLILWLA